MKREAIIKKYMIKDENLKRLLNDLILKPDSKPNRRLMQNALDGEYSDFGSSEALPLMMLECELRGEGYADLAKNVLKGLYDHPYGAKLKSETKPKADATTTPSFFSRAEKPPTEDAPEGRITRSHHK